MVNWFVLLDESKHDVGQIKTNWYIQYGYNLLLGWRFFENAAIKYSSSVKQ